MEKLIKQLRISMLYKEASELNRKLTIMCNENYGNPGAKLDKVRISSVNRLRRRSKAYYASL